MSKPCCNPGGRTRIGTDGRPYYSCSHLERQRLYETQKGETVKPLDTSLTINANGGTLHYRDGSWRFLLDRAIWAHIQKTLKKPVPIEILVDPQRWCNATPGTVPSLGGYVHPVTGWACQVGPIPDEWVWTGWQQVTPAAAKVSIALTADEQALGDLGTTLGIPAADENRKCASLPSGTAAFELVNGDLAALPRVLAHTALRATLIGTGMYLIGVPKETLVRNAIAGSVGIDMFVLLWATIRKRETAA